MKCLGLGNPKLGKLGRSKTAPVVKRQRGGSWKRIRLRILKRDGYLCQECQRMGRVTMATDVDHVTPLADGGTDDDKNLQSLCGVCHKKKTREENSRRG
ncbi:HNH endonuclease [Desulfobulbus rhabdoformis]|nr:HNH endonuclease signature motif containing protein [Desulfobulbus rhabdoformis]MBM9615321.1 HNH endonuclease [Desulfobulbus rhabdoformis]